MINKPKKKNQIRLNTNKIYSIIKINSKKKKKNNTNYLNKKEYFIKVEKLL